MNSHWASESRLVNDILASVSLERLRGCLSDKVLLNSPGSLVTGDVVRIAAMPAPARDNSRTGLIVAEIERLGCLKDEFF